MFLSIKGNIVSELAITAFIISLYPSSLQVIFHDGVVDIVKGFLCKQLDNHVVFVFQFAFMVDYIYLPLG